MIYVKVNTKNFERLSEIIQKENLLKEDELSIIAGLAKTRFCLCITN